MQAILNRSLFAPYRIVHADCSPWVEHVDRFPRRNEDKASRERLILIRVYAEVRALGYEGSYDAVRRYARTRAKARGRDMSSAPMMLTSPMDALAFSLCFGTTSLAHGDAVRGERYPPISGSQTLRGVPIKVAG